MVETALRAPADPDAGRRGGARSGIDADARRKFRLSLGSSLDSLPPAWLHLQETGLSTPFQTQAWLLPWYRIIGANYGAKPLFLTVSDARTNEPLMFFPLCIRQEGRLTRIEFPDLGVSDYNAPLLAAHFQPTELQLRRIMRSIFLELPPADLLCFDKFPEFLGQRPNPMLEHEMFHRMRFQSWESKLPATREQFDSTLPSTFRKELQRKHRRLAGRGSVELCETRNEADAQIAFETLCDQRRERFTELGRKDILEDAVYRDFYETIILSSLRTGFATLTTLRCDDESVAIMLGLHHAKSYHLLMSTIQSGKWKSCSPGNVAIDSMITALIGLGDRNFDFTIGDETYKHNFGAKPHQLYECVRAQSIFGAAQAFSMNFRSIVRNRLRPLKIA